MSAYTQIPASQRDEVTTHYSKSDAVSIESQGRILASNRDNANLTGGISASSVRTIQRPVYVRQVEGHGSRNSLVGQAPFMAHYHASSDDTLYLTPDSVPAQLRSPQGFRSVSGTSAQDATSFAAPSLSLANSQSTLRVPDGSSIATHTGNGGLSASGNQGSTVRNPSSATGHIYQQDL